MRRGPQPREVFHLAQDLRRARGSEFGSREPAPNVDASSDGEWGRAVVLLGAGCSTSAGIPLAAGVARRATVHLAEGYGVSFDRDGSEHERAKAALEALVEKGHFPTRFVVEGGSPPWGPLYTYIFSDHIKHPVEQRRFIVPLIGRLRTKLNWAHVCLGALVKERFFHTVLTTNFDQLALQSVIRTGIVPVVADGLESLNRISPMPDWPQVVHLHGSMHTYELRNSQEALRETEQDRGLQVMVMSLLREATVFVVVGYAGGEEGIMALLRHAAEALPRMVIYWVAFEDDYRRFSLRARDLLEVGENKFFIPGQDADDFFNALVGELGIGAPEWIKRPVGVLAEQAESVVAQRPPGDNVTLIVQAYKDRVAKAVREENEGDDDLEQAAFHLSARRYEEAERAIAKLDYAGDPILLRMHAKALYRQYSRAARPDLAILMRSIPELERLVEVTEDRNPDDTEMLIDAYWDAYDAPDTDEATRLSMPGKIKAAAERCQAHVDRGRASREWSLMRFYQAEAIQLDAERRDIGGEGCRDPRGERVSRLRDARVAYQDALVGLAESHATKARECKEGLAGALIALAESATDAGERSACSREALSLFRDVVEFARVNTPDERHAGAIENLVDALRSSRELIPTDAPASREEERRLLHSALAIYHEFNDPAGLGRVRTKLVDIEG